MADVEIRTLDEADLDAAGTLRTIAFGGPQPPLTPDTMAFPVDRTVAAYVGSRLVGMVGVIEFTQWFGGQEVPCGGVAGVTMSPDQRGRGVARSLLSEALGRMKDAGQVVSALYPTTASLYRSLGWEISGWWAQRSAAVAELPAPSGSVRWEPVPHIDDGLRCVYETCARGRDGWVVPTAGWWRASGNRRAARATPAWSWVGRRGAALVAAVVYHHSASERGLFDLEADLVAGVDGPALTDALAFLGGHGTTADRALTTLPARLLARHMVEGSRSSVRFDWPWMLRVVDVPGAFAARGWPADVSIEVDLDVTSPGHRSGGAASQRWMLRVEDGAATCEPGGGGTIALSVGDLASLYAGGVDPAALASEGRLTGADERTLSGLRAAFAGDPTLPWFF